MKSTGFNSAPHSRWIPIFLCTLVLSSIATHTAGASDAKKADTWREDAARYAQLLSTVRWTPVADTLPNRRGGYFEKGKVYTGVPYSSVKSEGRYIGYDISLRTFLAAVENPQSVVYTKNLAGKVPNAAAYYGTVCSAYTSYALGAPFPIVSRRHGPPISHGVEIVARSSDAEGAAQKARVGDVIYTPPVEEKSGSHVEIVTQVTRDQDGRTLSLRVEESRPPTTQITERSESEFDAYLKLRNKQLLHISDIEQWRGAVGLGQLRFPNYQIDAATPDINRSLLLDLGDWVPYQKGATVRFNIMDRDQKGAKALVIERDGYQIERIDLDGLGIQERVFSDCGDYTAYLIQTNGSRSQACQFAICDLKLEVPSGDVSTGQSWELSFHTEDMTPAAIHLMNSGDSYGRHTLFLTEEQRQTGTFTVPAGLLKKPGTLQVWLIGEHELGRLKVRKDVKLVK